MSKEVTNKIFTLPNLISFIRLLLVPLFALALMVYENNVVAFILFVIAASTDFLDGAVARGTGQVSRLGQQLDPLVDRILILTAVILVYLLGRVPFWILMVIIARDLAMLVLIAQLRATNQPKLEVAFVGKAGTALNMIGFCFLILYWPLVDGLGVFESAAFPGWGSSSAPLGIWFIYVGVVLAWAAGIYYMVRAYVRSKQLPGKKGGTTKRDNQAQRAQANGDTQALSARGGLTATRKPQSNTAARTASAQQKQQPAHRGNNASSARGSASTKGGIAALPFLNTPKKMLISVAILILLMAGIGFYSFDSANNFGVIHSGVTVGGIDVGHMKEADAAALLNAEFNALASSAPVVLFANEEAAEAGANEQTVQLGNGVAAYDQTELDHEVTSWSVTLATFDAEVDGGGLAQKAYAVGRGGDFILGRIAASTFGVDIAPTLTFAADRLHSLEEQLTETLGTPMKNASISFDGTTFVAADGQDGVVVEEEQFVNALTEAFLSENREIIVPMVERKMYVTLEEAEEVAANTQAAIKDPVTINYNDSSWTFTTTELGQVISSDAEEDEHGNWQLRARVDSALLEAFLPHITGYIEDQIAPLDAEFVEVDGTLEILPSQNGTGVDYGRLADDLNTVLFGLTDDETQEDTGEAPSRTVELTIGVLEPDLKTSEAEAFNFETMISQYTIDFAWVPQGTITNVHVASDLLNSSIIAPQGTWSFNETAGECTAEKGFVEAAVILGDAYVDEIGGGVCNVASAVYNAAYEGGYPIAERINHSLRLTRYPLGRDAAIAYPYADLKFVNDTDNYLLLTMSYTDSTVTCSLWGIPPGYTIESVPGELIEVADYYTKKVVDENLYPGQSYVEQEGKEATRVEVTRTVYDAAGTVKEQRTFYSSYDATPEIIRVGPEATS